MRRHRPDKRRAGAGRERSNYAAAAFRPTEFGLDAKEPQVPKQQTVKSAIRALSDDAVTVLEQALRDEDVRVRLVASQMLLDRGYGGPAQATDVTLTTKQDASNAHLQALLEVARLQREVPVELGDGQAHEA